VPPMCPHGGPIMVHLSQAQLERHFGRAKPICCASGVLHGFDPSLPGRPQGLHALPLAWCLLVPRRASTVYSARSAQSSALIAPPAPERVSRLSQKSGQISKLLRCTLALAFVVDVHRRTPICEDDCCANRYSGRILTQRRCQLLANSRDSAPASAVGFRDYLHCSRHYLRHAPLALPSAVSIADVTIMCFTTNTSSPRGVISSAPPVMLAHNSARSVSDPALSMLQQVPHRPRVA